MTDMNDFTPFLKSVVADVVAKSTSTNDFSNWTIVSPNKRARLFFNKYLFQKVGSSAIWAPQCLTSIELFQSFGHKQNIHCLLASDFSDVDLISDLYSVYTSVFVPTDAEAEPMSFSKFYFFGQIIVSDFNDCDKYLEEDDVSRLFKVLADYKNLDEGYFSNFLSPEQIEALRKLKVDFCAASDGNSNLLKSFDGFWQLLKQMYVLFKQHLEGQHLAYEGMLCRGILKGDLSLTPEDRIAFVGFNALNNCEKDLMRRLKKQYPNQVFFYWDYDVFYFNPDSSLDASSKRIGYKDDAGLFLRQNVLGYDPNRYKANASSVSLKLPSELTASSSLSFDNLKRLSNNNIQVYKASTDTAQTKFVSHYLRQMKKKNVPDDDIAIVLCDEALLPSVLHSIPDEIKNVNVTMGFPLAQTSAYHLMSLLMSLLGSDPKNGEYKSYYFIPLLRNADVLRTLGPMPDGSPVADRLLNYLFGNTIFNVSSENLIANNSLSADASSFLRLLLPKQDKITAYDVLTKLSQILSVVASHCRYNNSLNASDKQQTSAISSDAEDPNNYRGLEVESFYRICTNLNLIAGQLVANNNLTELLDTKSGFDNLFDFVRKQVRSLKVPFSGEPARGLQIIGFLETRNLDFENVLFLSVNEDFLPKGSNGSSFIPYNLRFAFGLPTAEHEDALYAYNFYRLLQRPHSISVVYNCASTESKAPEISRFMLQLRDELTAWKTENVHSISFDIPSSTASSSIKVLKTPEILAALMKGWLYDSSLSAQDVVYSKSVDSNAQNVTVKKGSLPHALSPSALNSYKQCSLLFYFRYVLHLNLNDDLDDSIDSATFGTVFHAAMANFYVDVVDKDITKTPWENDWFGRVDKEHVSCLFYGKEVEDVVKQYIGNAFESEFNLKKDNLEGEQVLKFDILTRFMLNQLTHDGVLSYVNGKFFFNENMRPFFVFKPEYPVAYPFTVKVSSSLKENLAKLNGIHSLVDAEGNYSLFIGGDIDRRDVVGLDVDSSTLIADLNNGTPIRILDYKTGKQSDVYKTSFENLFSTALKDSHQTNYFFQILLYRFLFNKQVGENYSTTPGLVYPLIDAGAEQLSQIGYSKEDSLTFTNNPLPWPVDFSDNFEAGLKSLVSEILNEEVPFQSTEFSDHCKYCDFAQFCQ